MSLSKDLSIALSLILKSKTVFSHSIALNLVPGSHFRRRNISCQNKNILVRGALNASISGFFILGTIATPKFKTLRVELAICLKRKRQRKKSFRCLLHKFHAVSKEFQLV